MGIKIPRIDDIAKKDRTPVVRCDLKGLPYISDVLPWEHRVPSAEQPACIPAAYY